MTAPAPRIRPGQVWADNDKRAKGRHVRVIAVNDTRAGVAACLPDGTLLRRARATTIRLDRFRPISTGYRLVRDAPQETS